MRKIVVAATALPVILLLGIGFFVTVSVQHSLIFTRAQLAKESNLAFEVSTATHIENPGFEPLATPSSYRTAAVFEGKLYLAGPGGLAEFPTLEATPHLWRTGLELSKAARTGEVDLALKNGGRAVA